MSTAALLQNTAVKPQQSSPLGQGGLLLQRQCACGSPTSSLTGECEACKSKKGLQAKLTIGASNDPLEQEADRVADQVLAAPLNAAVSGAPPHIQRYAGQATGQVDTAPVSVDRVLASSGRQLEPTLQQEMEQRFGHDFSRVRIHSGGAAEQSARDVNANAYTVGHHIVFGAGQFRLGSAEGRRLLAHELAHIIQQGGGRARSSSPRKMDEPPDDALSQAEHRNAAGGAGGAALGTDASLPGSPLVQRQKDLLGPSASNSAAAVPMPAPSAPAAQSQWTLEDPRISFSISNQKIRDASSLMVGGPATGPGFTAWSNRRVFSIIPSEQAWLHTNYWVDTAEHPLPPNQRHFSVTNDIKFTTSSGQTTVDVHYSDDNPKYDGPGRTLSPKLGHTSPAARDLPVYDLPLNEGGELIWRAGFSFAPGGKMFEVREKFQVQAQGSGTSTQLDAKPSPDGPTKAAGDGPEKKSESKGESLPASPAPQQAPPAAVGEIKELTELIKKTSDAATKDPLVRKLRDLLSRLQPLIPTKDAQKAIDDAIRSLVKDGADEAIMAILKAITGKSPSTMPENRNQTGPDVPQKDLGEHIFQGPKIPWKDAPKPAPRSTFQYRNGPQKSYEAGAVIRFTLIPPDAFSPAPPSKYLAIVAEAERDKSRPEQGPDNGWFGKRIPLDSAAPKSIEVQAPSKPGKYVIRVDIGFSFDDSSIQEFEVIAPQKK